MVKSVQTELTIKKDCDFCFRHSRIQSFKGLPIIKTFLYYLCFPLFGLFYQLDVTQVAGRCPIAAPSPSPTAQPPQEGEVFFFATCSSTFSGSGPIGQTWVTCPGPKSHTRLRSGGGYCHFHQNHLGSLSGAVVPQRKKELLMSQGGTVGTG